VTAILVLQNGDVLQGKAIGTDGNYYGELVFNTAMTGYQEIATDPSYQGQIVILTTANIGNVGVCEQDMESDSISASGLILSNYCHTPSNWRSTDTLENFLVKHKKAAIYGLDTRYLTSLVRDKGTMSACICVGETNIATVKENLQKLNLTAIAKSNLPIKSQPKFDNLAGRHIAMLDFGVKSSITNMLVDAGFEVTKFAPTTKLTTIMQSEPAGILISNGPGDPASYPEAINTIARLIATGLPMFGICLGHQLICLALGSQKEKLKFGHHGANHPVMDSTNNRVFISSQNHGYCIRESTLPACLQVTHRSLFDSSLQGVKHNELPIFSFQGHPEAGPGPLDMRYLFAPFISAVRAHKPLAVNCV